MERVLNITKALSDGNRLRVAMTLKDCGELCARNTVVPILLIPPQQ